MSIQIGEQMACPKCNSNDIITGARVFTNTTSAFNDNLQVEVCKNPNAFIFKGYSYRELTASICGQCGYTEMYVNNPKKLFDDYNNKKS